MASNRPAAKKTPTASAAPAAPKKPRVPGMTRAQKFDLMLFVKDFDASAPDITAAKAASEKFGRSISAITIGAYRKDLGLESVPALSKSALLARIAELEARIAELQAA